MFLGPMEFTGRTKINGNAFGHYATKPLKCMKMLAKNVVASPSSKTEISKPFEVFKILK